MTVNSVADEPEVVLTRWGIMQENMIGFRLVGVHAATGRARVTSPIVVFEALTLIARTESGRFYTLRGPADDDMAARLIHEFIRRENLTAQDVALAQPEEVEISFAPAPSGRH